MIKLSKIILLSSFLFLQFACSRNDDEIINYFHDHQVNRRFLVGNIQAQFGDIASYYEGNKDKFKKDYFLANEFGKYTDSLISIIENKDFDSDQLIHEYINYVNSKIQNFPTDSKEIIESLADFKTVLSTDQSKLNRKALINKILRIQFLYNESIINNAVYRHEPTIKIFIDPVQRKIKRGEYYETEILMIRNFGDKPSFISDTNLIVIGNQSFYTTSDTFHYKNTNSKQLRKVNLEGKYYQFNNFSNDSFFIPFIINFEIINDEK